MVQLSPIRGFTNTPISRVICIRTTILVLTLAILELKQYVAFAIDPFLVEYNQYWRVLTFQTAVVNESDYLLVIILWFYYKNLERFFGSRKYLSIIAIFAATNAVASFVLMSVGQLMLNFVVYFLKVVVLKNIDTLVYEPTFLNEIIPGPMGIISSLYICYSAYIPSSYEFKILLSNPVTSSPNSPSRVLILTNHFPIHIIYTLLFFNNGVKSIIPCLVGLLIGKLHTNELLPGNKSWLLPRWMFKLFIDPLKVTRNAISSLTRRRNGYQPVGAGESADTPNEENNNEENSNDDPEVEVDESRNNLPRVEIRAETPVRPLGTQILNTFRT